MGVIRVINADRKPTPAVVMQLVLNRLRTSGWSRFNHANCNTMRVVTTQCVCVWSIDLIQTDRQTGSTTEKWELV